jgi:DNA-binding NarL/FixJ family response regulator
MDQPNDSTVPSNLTSIFVVEGSPEIRKRLVAMVRRVAGVKLTGESGMVSEAFPAIQGGEVGILLLGLTPMGARELEGLARMKRIRPQLRAIVLADSSSQQYTDASVAAGAAFCLDKSREFGRVPAILRDWVDAASSRTSNEQDPT